MSESKELAVAEQPQQLITIEPKKYVELVFEPFVKRLENARALAKAAEFDVTTTAGMAVAVKHRATFREIRVASEKARKERKAPILEIGKLLDTRQKEIEAEIEPYESRFDAAIKAEKKRKDDEKIAKALAEPARISAIRSKIADMQAIPSTLVGKSSETIAAAIESLEVVEITLETHAEFAGESEMVKAATVLKLSAMLEAQKDHEAEAARIAAERDQLERERAEAAERERIAVAARAEQEARDRAERERVAAEQRAAQDKAAAELRAQQEAHERLMAEQRAEIARQQAEIDRQKAEAERVERERLAAIEAEAQAKRDAEEAEAKLEVDHAEGLLENARIDAAREAAFEAQQQENQRRADEAERIRRERVQFELNGPDAREMIEVLAAHYQVEQETALNWINRWVWAEVEVTA